jgi:hypothetical protein
MTEKNDTIRVLIPLKLRKKNGRPTILPPADYKPSEDRTQDPHILRAIGRAWAWRRRLEAGEVASIDDLAEAEKVSDRFVSRILRLTYLSPEVLRRLLIERQPPTVDLPHLIDATRQPWEWQSEHIFD